MKRKLSIFLAAVVCLSLLLTGCNGGGNNSSVPSIPDIIASLTTEQVVLKAMDGLRKDGAYKTIDGTISMNVPADKSDGSYVTGGDYVDFNGVFENKKLSADITYYTVHNIPNGYEDSETGEWKYGDPNKEKSVYLSYIREDDIYEQMASVYAGGDDDTEYNAATKESLTKLAKDTIPDTYSHWSTPEMIKYFFNGFGWEVNDGAFGVIDCLKASREASKTLEDNIAKKLVSLWGVTATRQQDKTYVVTLDVNKAIGGTFELCDTIADYLVKNKGKTVRTLIEDEVSPARLFINSILYGVSGISAEKILTDIFKLYGCVGQLNNLSVVATEEDTALTYLTKFLNVEDGNGLAFGDRTIEEIINYHPLHDMFYSYDGETETLDLAGWKDLKKMIKDGIGEGGYLDFALNSDYIIESIKGGCDIRVTANVNGIARFDYEIYFNREVELEGEIVADYLITPTDDAYFEVEGNSGMLQKEDTNVKLSNAEFKYCVKEGVITIGLYLTDGAKVFEHEVPSGYARKGFDGNVGYKFFYIKLGENITNENGETVLSNGDGMVLNAYVTTVGEDYYICISLEKRYDWNDVYRIYFKGTAKAIRLKDYKES